jgi:hypothetical protein
MSSQHLIQCITRFPNNSIPYRPSLPSHHLKSDRACHSTGEDALRSGVGLLPQAVNNTSLVRLSYAHNNPTRAKRTTRDERAAQRPVM